jgi:phosphohistidine swiveling domain-containing protein
MSNALHRTSLPGTTWSTANAAENIPGVMTPLGASFWLDVVELGLRGSFSALGVIPKAEVRATEPPDESLVTVFFGRFVVNVDIFRRFSDLTPGASGREFEESLLGSVRDLPVTKLAPWRYGLFATRAPLVASLLPGRTHAKASEVREWWQGMTGPERTQRPAAVRLGEAFGWAVMVMRLQLLATFIAQGMFDQLGTLARDADQPDAHLSLMTGYGQTEEVRMVSMLYRLAHGEGSLEDFLLRYGARCPGENELSAHSWREDPAPVEALARKYKRATTIADPASQEAEREAERSAAEQRVLGGLSSAQRPGAKLVFRLGRTFIPLREENKGSLAMTMDAGRAAARDLGAELVAQGRLDDPDDVFYYTLPELVQQPPADPRPLVAERRVIRTEYEGYDLPQFWMGQPEPIVIGAGDGTDERADELVGMAASNGVVEGRARVLLGAEEIDDIEPGEVLVCRTTDPSWASAFHLVSATVIDIGGPVSHGAIVSREMGIPCVINTEKGTRVLRTGDLLRVDGTAGQVTVLERAS